MKKIVKLKGELAIGLILSVIIGTISAFIINEIYRGTVLNKNRLEELAVERNREAVEYLEKYLDIKSKSEEVVEDNLKKLEKNLNYRDINRVFIVDREGNIKSSTGKFKIEKLNIDLNKRLEMNMKENTFIAINILEINAENYLVYLNENMIYSDMLIFQIGSIITIIIFVLFIKGRVTYISNIAESVKVIAKGNFSKKVDVKYNNELSDLAKDINYMAEELEREEINKNEFITNISHDLRTPLTTLLGYSKMIDEKVYSNEEDLKRYISIINKKGEYLKVMIEDFFEYAKLSSKDISLEKQKININELVSQLLTGEEIKFNEKNLNLNLDLSKERIEVIGDPMLIGRAFDNLISNALKYSKEGTDINIRLKEELINKNRYNVFSIENIPENRISKDEIEKIFKRLYKIDKARNDKGTGLGLSISREIIKLHNGELIVELDSEKIRFSIKLKIENL